MQHYTTETSDETIVHAIQQGNVEAFGDIIIRYESKLKRYARKFLRHREDIEDLVQDVFIKSYTNIKSFDTHKRFSPWIYRIAHNTFINALKRKDRILMTLLDPDTMIPFLVANETADKTTLDTELRIHIDTILGAMSPKFREIIILHDIEGLSYADIASTLHLSVTTVGVRLNRARKQMKKIYESQK